MRLAFLCALAILQASPPARAEPSRGEPTADLVGAGFKRFSTVDKLARNITYYLATPRGITGALPLAVFVQGSGCDSQFRRSDGAIVGRVQDLLVDAARTRISVMVVEKPGVKFLDESQQMGTAEGCSAEFLREHTLSRWAEAVGAAIRSAVKLPQVDTRRLLIVGWSEGGIVAARVAAENPGTVTHVASLAGGGPTQLFDLVVAASTSGSDVLKSFAAMQQDRESVTKFWLGHPYRRWTSFMSSSVRDELMRTNARIFIAHGTDDQQAPVVSFDMLRAELMARDKPLIAERIEGVGHLFCKNDQRSPEGMRALLQRLVDWFLR
jgi:dienelactone hydrolase